MDSTSKLENYLEALKYKNIPFIVLSSGSSGKDVIERCQKYSFIKEVIIFCGNYIKYQHYLNQYPGYVKQIFTNITEVYGYIKSFGSKYDQGIKEFRKSDHFIFSPEDIKMNKQLEQCPVISAYEYDYCYFLVHKAYAYFFRKDKMDVYFTKFYFSKIQEYIMKSKQNLISQFFSLVDKQNFVELSLRLFTDGSYFCYIFNRTMRNFEKGLISLAYYMEPFLYAVNKYVEENPNLGLNKNMILYRNIICSELDYYLYKMNLHHIICFPSITATSIQQIGFVPSGKSNEINKNEDNYNNMYKITMIFNYKYEPGNISPGIVLLDNKGKDGEYLSKHPVEKEVMLFPFTFARITDIREVPTEKNKLEIYFDIIKRKQYIELTLKDINKDNVEKKPKFSNLD